MTRTRILLVTTAMALALPLASVTAQTKCGPVAFSAEKMTYTSMPCAGGETVGTSGPTAGASNSTSMTKAEMKQGAPIGYAPMQAQAVQAGPNMAPAADQCSALNAVALKDEFGRKYNCRGDRIR